MNTSQNVTSCRGRVLGFRSEDSDWRHAHQIPRGPTAIRFRHVPKLVFIPTWRTVGRLHKIVLCVIFPAGMCYRARRKTGDAFHLWDRKIVIGPLGFKASKGTRPSPNVAPSAHRLLVRWAEWEDSDRDLVTRSSIPCCVLRHAARKERDNAGSEVYKLRAWERL